MAVERAGKVTKHPYEHAATKAAITNPHPVLCGSDNPRPCGALKYLYRCSCMPREKWNPLPPSPECSAIA